VLTVAPKNNVSFSMANPVYALTAISEEPTKVKSAPKHHAKIDTSLRINNLSQEVNMPLLRLVHQLYSIIEDAIDYDKEQSKLLVAAATDFADWPLDLPLDTADNPLHRQASFKRNSLSRGPRFASSANRASVWKFMDDIIENRELLPTGTKYTEKDEVGS
jgi:hypothetical protein